MTARTQAQSRETYGWDLLETIDNRVLTRGKVSDGVQPHPRIRIELLSGTVQRDCCVYVKYENSAPDDVVIDFTGHNQPSALAGMLEEKFLDWHRLIRDDRKHFIKPEGSQNNGNTVPVGPAAPALLVTYGRLQALLARSIADLRNNQVLQNPSQDSWDRRRLRTLEKLAGRFDLGVTGIVKDASSHSAWPF